MSFEITQRKTYRKRGVPVSLAWLKSLSTPDENTGCWLWNGFIRDDGYGAISLDGKLCLVHRAAFLLSKGAIPVGLHVCHSCDVRRCINPNHLWAGTNADNMADRNRKNRQARLTGERNGFHRLSEKEVLEIRESKSPGVELARKFETSVTNISMIRTHQTWKHV